MWGRLDPVPLSSMGQAFNGMENSGYMDPPCQVFECHYIKLKGDY